MNIIQEWRGYSISDIFENVANSSFIFIHTLIVDLEFWLNSMVGKNLGWLEIQTSSFIITDFIVLFLMEVFRPYKKYQINSTERISYLIITGIIFCAVIVSMWLSWTPITNNAIEGVQGRYFLPILPVLFLVFVNSNKIRVKSSVSMNVLVICMLNVYAVLDVLKVTFGR